MSELAQNGVQIYYFPTDDETVSSLNQDMNVSHSCIICWSAYLYICVFDEKGQLCCKNTVCYLYVNKGLASADLRTSTL